MPFPADYGGVIDVFYRTKALHELRVMVHLHCFEYGRGRQPELEKYCASVNYYERHVGWKGFSFRLPYIVYSRRSKKLLKNLCMDDHPILLEGVHCTHFLLAHPLNNRKVFVRLQNIEHEYYHNLSMSKVSYFNRAYYFFESRLLKNYEKRIAGKARFFGITPGDVATAEAILGKGATRYLPAFVPFDTVSVKEGIGEYCLYHGNLSVAENEKAAAWLCQHVFARLNIPLIIAGKNPSEKLVRIIDQSKNCSLQPNLPEEKMNDLIRNAQVNILPSFNSTGIKIKLLHALFNGRHCVVNKASVHGTSLASLCCIADTPEECIAAIEKLMDAPLTKMEMEKRITVLKKFDNQLNAEKLMQWIQ